MSDEISNPTDVGNKAAQRIERIYLDEGSKKAAEAFQNDFFLSKNPALKTAFDKEVEVLQKDDSANKLLSHLSMDFGKAHTANFNKLSDDRLNKWSSTDFQDPVFRIDKLMTDKLVTHYNELTTLWNLNHDLNLAYPNNWFSYGIMGSDVERVGSEYETTRGLRGFEKEALEDNGKFFKALAGPSGSISYQEIEAALKSGTLTDKQKELVKYMSDQWYSEGVKERKVKHGPDRGRITEDSLRAAADKDGTLAMPSRDQIPKDSPLATALSEKEAARKAALAAKEAEKAEAERVALAAKEAEKAEADRVALAAKEAEKAEAERVALAAKEAEKAEAERVALAAKEAEKAEAERVALAAKEAERAEAERVALVAKEAEKAEAERVALAAKEAEKAEAERVALAAKKAEKAEAERVALAAKEAEKAEAERVALAAKEAERIAAAKAAQIEAERLAAAKPAQGMDTFGKHSRQEFDGIKVHKGMGYWDVAAQMLGYTDGDKSLKTSRHHINTNLTNEDRVKIYKKMDELRRSKHDDFHSSKLRPGEILKRTQ